MFVANKIDYREEDEETLAKENIEVLTKEEIEEKITKEGLKEYLPLYCECSAKSGVGINEFFNKCMEAYIKY